MKLTCEICGFVGEGGLGYWACHADEDTTPVCRGRCFEDYQQRKRAVAQLGELGEQPRESALKSMLRGNNEFRRWAGFKGSGL